MTVSQPTASEIEFQVKSALEEDIGSGDRTAQLIPETATAMARLICRDEAVLCGVDWFNEVFRQLGGSVDAIWSVTDGDVMAPGQEICTLSGQTRSLLAGERTALNFVQLLSGTATTTRRYVSAVTDTGVRILDTRKTVPGYRLAQKYAVTCGGGHNHRIGLYDAILIKENHIVASGSISTAVGKARQTAPELSVEVEVESLGELSEALLAGVNRVLLDNFSLQLLREAVKLNAGRACLEASGGVNLHNVREIALTGVDDISVGALTKDICAVDLSLRFS